MATQEVVAVPEAPPLAWFSVGATALHILSRKLVLFVLWRSSSAAGLSLITQELFLIVYVSRYLDILALVVSVGDTLLKLARIAVAVAIVLLIRYSATISQTYEHELDKVPRAALLLPPFLAALVWHRYLMIVEIFHQFSWYLEPLALIPQFVLLANRRGAYPRWVLAYLAMAGAEGLLDNWPLLTDPQESLQSNPYGVYAAWVQCGVLVLGAALLVVQAVRSRQQAGLNESANKPAFDQEWQAGKFAFVGEQSQPEALPLLGGSGPARGPLVA